MGEGAPGGLRRGGGKANMHHPDILESQAQMMPKNKRGTHQDRQATLTGGLANFLRAVCFWVFSN